MPRPWMTIRVELIGGLDIECDPPPGRTMLVDPRHTFAALAEAIDAAFARWDLSHLHLFELADGRRLGRPEPDWDVLDDEVIVREELGAGDRFIYVFDLGDDWTHACEVEAVTVDPAEAYGMIPSGPVAIWGWGSISDQYGRRWDGDSGEDDEPPSIPRVGRAEWLAGGNGMLDRWG